MINSFEQTEITCYTIHQSHATQSYGGETSQRARQNILNAMGYRHIYLALEPQMTDWITNFTSWGFRREDLVCIPHTYSDLGHELPSLRELEGDWDSIVYNDEGFIVSAERGDCITYFTSAPYLVYDRLRMTLTWYDSQQRSVLYATYALAGTNQAKMNGWLYHFEDKVVTTEDLGIQWLVANTKPSDIFFRDTLPIPSPKLIQFLKFRGSKYFEFIHMDVTRHYFNHLVSNITRHARYLAASEPLAETLQADGFANVTFMPPVYVTPVQETKTYQGVKNYCLVGNFGDIKRVDMAIEAFSLLEERGLTDYHLTIYGGRPEEVTAYQEKGLPSNVTLAGFQAHVPYDQHEAFLSCSLSELFSVACVEAMAAGLIPVLSRSALPFTYYAQYCSNIQLFDGASDLADLVVALTDKPLSNAETIAFTQRYSLESLMAYYQSIILS